MAVAGTVIGAGFATGKELLIFFNGNSVFYLLLMIASVILVGVTSVLYFYYAKKSGDSKLLTAVFLAFSGGGYVIMLACGGQALYDSLNISYNFGVFITFLITMLIIRFGIEGIYKFNLFVTPIIIVSLIFISFVGLSSPVFNNSQTPFVNSFLYAGYNILAVLPFISAIAKETDKKDGFWGITIGFVLILAAGISAKLLLNSYFSLISSESIPIFKIVSILSPYFSYIYSVVLYSAILTTAATLIYILTKGKRPKELFLISVPLLILSFAGFTTLLEKIYTGFGYIGIIIILIIIARRIFNGKQE